MSRAQLGTAAIGVAAALLLTLLLRQGGYLSRLEHQAADARSATLMREVATDIVIVGIDANSLARLQAWPWPRRHHATLLQQLRAAGPKRVFVDIDFSSPSTPADDTLLAAELARWPQATIILPAFVQAASGSDPRLSTTVPLSAFSQNAQLAAVNQLVDDDGLVRRFRSSWDLDGRSLPSLAALLADSTPSPDQILPIDYAIAPASFSYLSYADVLRGKFATRELADKTVMVCATASELNDILAVPVHRSLAGCVVQALELQTLQLGVPRPPGATTFYLLLAAWAVVCSLLFSVTTWRVNLLLLGGSLVLPLVAATGLYAGARIVLDPIPWMLVAIVSFVAISLRALDRETLRALTYALGIRRRDALMTSIVETSMDGIFCIDHHGRIQSVNPAGARLLQSEASSLRGTAIGRFLPSLTDAETVLRSPPKGLSESQAESSIGRSFPVEYGLCRVGFQEQQLFTVVVRDISDRNAHEDKLRYQAMHDSLTALPNRAAMGDFLERALTRATTDQPMALLMLDLCRFKEVNDTLGHDVGDQVLRVVAERLRQTIGERGFLARIGGDEFVAILHDRVDAEAVESLAAALCAAMQVPLHATQDDGVAIDLSVSIGVALFPRHATDSQTLLKNADVAMYAAKRRGSRFEYYDASLDEHSLRKLTMAAELRRAIGDGELRLFFQPQFNMHSGQVDSAEALLRWPHPTMGDVNPVEFIAIAESTDLIQPLTDWTLRTALRQVSDWQQQGLKLRVAVNLSARVLQNLDFPARLRAMLEASSVPARLLELEITESAMMVDADRAMTVVREIHSLGSIVSIDDYGTGFSSLAYLRDLPIHALKLDKSFVLSMREHQADRSIVESTAQLAHALRLKVVAEGVETAWHAQELQALGYDYAQGFHFSRALPADAFAGWLEQYRPPTEFGRELSDTAVA